MQEALKRMSALYEYSSALTKIDVLEYLFSDEYKVGLNDTQAEGTYQTVWEREN